MKKLLLPYVISIICISCKNGSSQASIDNDLSKRDSIQIALYNDSIKRELIFEALGDTVFGDICYGASYNQYQTAIKKFVASLITNSNYDFCLAGCNFKIKQAVDIKEIIKNSNISELEAIRLGGISETLFSNNKLCAVCWYTTDISSSSSSGGAKKMFDLISLFEKKYGKPNIKKAFVSSGVVAEWETNTRKVTFNYTFSSSRLYIQFVNKQCKKNIDKYIDVILKGERKRQSEIRKQDSINQLNAL